MTLANKITIFRIVLIIAFMVGFAMPGLAWAWASLLIFALACASDYVDGYIARNFNQVTTFGKFMDPLADKLLVIAALVCFVGAGIIPAWIAVVIICRDMLVDMMRTIAVSSGKVVAANWWGKWKTAFQMFAIISFLLERV
ncbi:MAG: CDP-diacylglycerol--glycerol-3-phosphate 3-phosphatidyltransferase, partial [Oscillospiraceae bacterium]|nr:CDP-diacylglycerol--glycerol-3-phosphate 3-phosphatidyltransferase [Oscillospiraceae bacterium]